ncbi:uncharacterized protein LOC114521714 [Dendronephthya gigantea]|uniref:uncharacterized protein LOC114521714 n=1 Tax=Dendronephthya gigantea TaxID=151771 RepID=UPI00106CAB68|nr:uncharacterized protein LOC114521714 [Dendronephthya gigantea]
MNMVPYSGFVIWVLLLLSSTWPLVGSTKAHGGRAGKFSVYRDVRIRKEFTTMSYGERKRFVRAYKFVSTHQPFKRRFEYLVGLHQRLFKKVHVEKQFFPWHRWYLLQFENLLRRVDPRITLPYWDWSIRSQRLWETGRKSVWNNYPWGLGGNGTGMFSCVDTGPFSKRTWRLAPKSGGGCLRRNFIGRMPSVVTVHRTLRYTAKQFKIFEDQIREFYHNELHCCIQGTMELPSASNTPEFLLHHTFMDKLWYDWQSKGPGYKFKIEDNLASRLRGSHYQVGQFMDPSHLGYSDTSVYYKDPLPGYKRLHAALGLLDLKALKMLDSYDWNSKSTCCPKENNDVERKGREIDKSLTDIPLEVALDYGG